jgi:cystathionine beta-lyase
VAIDEIPLEELRARRSVKWREYPAEVIPAWVAEMDFTLAEPIAAVLHAAIERSDTGYRWANEVPAALAEFAGTEWSWHIDPERVLVLGDVMTGIAQSLAQFTEPGDHIVINPPIYPPFFATVEKVAGRTVREVPLRRSGAGYEIDIEAMQQAFADPQVRGYVLCSPHNPTGTVHSRETLQVIADLAAEHGVLVISDEIHAPLTLPGAVHAPYLSVADDDARAVACLSASKTWNIPGLKCAQVVGTGATASVLREQVPLEATFGVGHFGVLGTLAAYRDGGAWRSQMLEVLDRRRRQLVDGLTRTEGVQVAWPEASYLAWVRIDGLGEDPAQVLLDEGNLALNSGLPFGGAGIGHVRINFATSETLLAEVLHSLGAVVRSRAS